MGSKSQAIRSAALIVAGLWASPTPGTQGAWSTTAAAGIQTSNASEPWLDQLLELDRTSLLARRACLARADWGPLAGELRRRFEAHGPGSEERKRLLDVAAQAPPPVARDLGQRLWAQDPDSFELDHQLAFAAQGVPGCESALMDHVAERQRSLCIREIRSAVFLALRGDAAGEALLQRAWDWTDLPSGGAGRALLVALALEQLDSKGALAEMRQRISQNAREARVQGAEGLALGLLQESRAFDRLLGSRGAEFELSELAWFGEKLGRRCIETGLELVTPGALFDSNRARYAVEGALSLPRGARPACGRATFSNVQGW